MVEHFREAALANMALSLGLCLNFVTWVCVGNLFATYHTPTRKFLIATSFSIPSDDEWMKPKVEFWLSDILPVFEDIWIGELKY